MSEPLRAPSPSADFYAGRARAAIDNRKYILARAYLLVAIELDIENATAPRLGAHGPTGDGDADLVAARDALRVPTVPVPIVRDAADWTRRIMANGTPPAAAGYHGPPDLSHAPQCCSREGCGQPLRVRVAQLDITVEGMKPRETYWYHLDPEITDHEPELQGVAHTG